MGKMVTSSKMMASLFFNEAIIVFLSLKISNVLDYN